MISSLFHRHRQARRFAAGQPWPRDDAAPFDDAFRANLRARLIATAERDGIGATARPTAPPAPPVRAPRLRRSGPRHAAVAVAAFGRHRRRVLQFTIGGALAGLVAVLGMATASTGSSSVNDDGPPQSATSQSQAAADDDEVDRGQQHLQDAAGRAGALVRGPTHPPPASSVLDDVDRETRAGTRLLTAAAVARRVVGPLDDLDRFALAQAQAIGGLRGAATGGTRARLDASMGLLDRVRARADGLRAALLCGAGPVDELGPTPRLCPAPTKTLPAAPTKTLPARPTPALTGGATTSPAPPVAAGGGQPASSPSSPAGLVESLVSDVEKLIDNDTGLTNPTD